MHEQLMVSLLSNINIFLNSEPCSCLNIIQSFVLWYLLLHCLYYFMYFSMSSCNYLDDFSNNVMLPAWMFYAFKQIWFTSRPAAKILNASCIFYSNCYSFAHDVVCDAFCNVFSVLSFLEVQFKDPCVVLFLTKTFGSFKLHLYYKYSLSLLHWLFYLEHWEGIIYEKRGFKFERYICQVWKGCIVLLISGLLEIYLYQSYLVLY